MSNSTLKNSLSPLQAPGEQFAQGKDQPTFSHEDFKKLIEARAIPTNIWLPSDQEPSGVQAFAAGLASNTVQGPASIVELARALKNDVDLIHEFVNNNIEYHCTHGLQKGGLGALVDGIANAWDQVDLMVQLLRQAGYTANYLFGELDLSQSDAIAWLGTTDIWGARNMLLNGGNASANVIWNGSENRLQFSHIWVKVQIAGTWYVFDPVVFKTYSTKTGINLTTALGYNATTFMNNARSGATINTDYVKNLNRTNVRNDLATMTSNLVSYIRTNNHAWSVDDVLGGKTINPLTPGVRNTTHPKQKSGTTPTEWTSIPNTYKHTLSVLYDDPNINISFYSADIYTKRLTLFFNASHQAELRLDGTLLATSSAQGIGTWNSVLLTATHPYGGTWADGSQWQRVWADKYYVIGNHWGTCGRGLAEIHRKKLAENQFAGISDSDERVLGESLAMMWHYHAATSTRNIDIVNKVTNNITVLHHQVGLIGYFDTPLIDIGLSSHSSSALDNDYSRIDRNDTTIAVSGISFEASTIEQMCGIAGVSATPIVDIASSGANKIFDAKSANWTSVRPQLVNYDTQTLDDIEAWYINSGYRVAIPENGSQTRGSWQGLAYFALPTTGAIGIIGGGLKGGGGADPITIPNENNANKNGVKNTNNKPDKGGGGAATAGGAVDLANGNENCAFLDMAIGSGEMPYKLTFARAYNSAARLLDGPLGLGWTHNFAMTAKANADGMSGLAEYLPIAGAVGIVHAFVCVDLLSDSTRPHDKFTTGVLASQWLVDQLKLNTVIVELPEVNLQFVKLPDGSFVAPPGSPATLVKNVDLTYTMKNPEQVAFNFGTDGNITSIVYPFGMTISFSYTAGKLSSVSNGLTRSFSFSYTGNYLSSISDGTGRSVSFSVNGTTKNLDSVTDPDSKTVSYVYDIPGRLTQMKNPANPTIAIFQNTYDSLGRVKEQRDAFNNLLQFFVAGSRTEVVDPNNNKRIYYFNRLGSITRDINEVGKETKVEYDGLNRFVKIIQPEGNYVLYTFDAQYNKLSRTDVAKSGSGLANIVNQATFHPTFNKVATHTDGRGNLFTYNYDAATGNLLSIVYPQVGSPLQTPQVSYTWNSRGQMLTRTDETGIVTQFNYDTATEKLNSIVEDFGISPHLNLTTSFGYTSRGDVNSVTDPRGKITTFAFDVKRRLTQKTDPSPLSYVTNFYYDANDNKWKIERQTGDVLNPWQTFVATFNYMDQLKTVTNPSSDVATWDYDNMRRLWKITDMENRVTENAYDAASRLYTVKDPSLTIAETRLYSDNGKIVSIKDARNNTTSLSYDGHDRLDRTTFADATYEQNQSYDANGNVLTYRCRSGNTIARTFDALNRAITKTPTGQPVVSYVYDLASRLTKASKPVVSGDPSSGDFQFFFDSAGRFWKEQYPDGKIVQHQLDANGNVTKTTWPDSYFVDRTYDELNRLIDIKLNGSGVAAAHYDWDPLSRKKKITFQNGTATDFTYQLDDDLATLVQTFVGSSQTFTYGFNKEHEMTSQQFSDGANYSWHPSAGGTTTYAAADVVNKYPTVGGVTYSYNSNGCLTGDGTWTFTFDTENHLLTANKTGTSVTNRYDPVHRQREHQVGSTKNRYIYANWQMIADYNNTTLQNRYVYGVDLDELLIRVASGGTLTYYHQNHQGTVIAQSNSSGAVVNRYKYSPFGESPSMTGTIHGFTGQRFETESGLYYYKNRYYWPKIGRFLQPDPLGYADDLNLYTYVLNDPLNLTDPLGLMAKGPQIPPGLIPGTSKPGFNPAASNNGNKPPSGPGSGQGPGKGDNNPWGPSGGKGGGTPGTGGTPGIGSGAGKGGTGGGGTTPGIPINIGGVNPPANPGLN